MKLTRLQIQYREDVLSILPCTTQHTGKLWSSSLQATMDAKSSCGFLKVVGFSCHYFFQTAAHRYPVSSSESPWGTNYRSLGKGRCRIGSLPCPAFRHSRSRNPPGTRAAQPLARRWSCSVTSQEVGDTCLSCRSIPCPGALAWVEHQWQELPAVFQPKSQSQQ